MKPANEIVNDTTKQESFSQATGVDLWKRKKAGEIPLRVKARERRNNTDSRTATFGDFFIIVLLFGGILVWAWFGGG